MDFNWMAALAFIGAVLVVTAYVGIAAYVSIYATEEWSEIAGAVTLLASIILPLAALVGFSVP